MLAAVAVGALIGALVYRTASRPPEHTTSRASAAGTPTDALSRKMDALNESVSDLRESVAALAVRREVAQTPAPACATSTSIPPAASASAPEPPSPEAMRAFDEVNRIFDRALEDHEWGPRQLQEYRAASAPLTGPQRVEMLHKLVIAVNSGKLRLKTVGVLM
jgi:hypothetical protein